MEFMDDEVLDPVAALSLNLKDLAACRIPVLGGKQNFKLLGLVPHIMSYLLLICAWLNCEGNVT